MNVAETVNASYAGYYYEHAGQPARTGENRFFTAQVSTEGKAGAVPLGTGFFEDASGRRYGMYAEYAKDSRKEQPIVNVTVQTNSGETVYGIDIRKVNPAHATEVEMFALSSYMDNNGMGLSGQAGTWQTLQRFKEDAVRSGYMEEPEPGKEADWQAMVNHVRRDYCDAGMIGEYHDAQKINAMFDTFDDRITFGGAYVFRMPCVINASAEERELGVAFLRYSEDCTFGLKAEYVKNPNADLTTVKVTVHNNGQEKEHYVNLEDVNPAHATEIEMFALISYMDANGLGSEFAQNTWQRLKVLRKEGLAKGYCGEISKDIEESGLEAVRMDWTRMLKCFAEEFREQGNSPDAMECEDLLVKLKTVTSDKTYAEGTSFTATDGENAKKNGEVKGDEPVDLYQKLKEDKEIGEYTTSELIERIREEIEKIREKVKNGDTEVSFQIGGTSFTLKEWDKLLEKFDTVQEAIREQMKEEIAKRNGEKVKQTHNRKSVIDSNKEKTGNAGAYEAVAEGKEEGTIPTGVI